MATESALAAPRRRRVGQWLRNAVWVAGGPARIALVASIRVYRVLLGAGLGGGCRFYPSCSHYAEAAIRSRGVIIGSALAIWRVLRCHPWSLGGIDHPPARRREIGPAAQYDGVIQREPAA